LAKHGPPESKNPIVLEVIKELKEKKGFEKIGVIGYCYGGRISAVLAAHDGIVRRNGVHLTEHVDCCWNCSPS
jgi:dienelactone hydrolase